MSDRTRPDGTTDDRAEAGNADGNADELIGSIGEEAAKLLAALQEWAELDVADGPHGTDGTGGTGGTGGFGGTAPFAAGIAAAAAAAHRVGEHVATGGPDCRYCPVCQMISAVRGTPPEVRAHLVAAASSLMQAVSGLLATPVPDGTTGGDRVEKIDLDDDWEDD